ncbi:MAG: hypothetical protein RLZZ133_1070 [Pseudomonadota bacterium]|jgi:hypothetical protein
MKTKHKEGKGAMDVMMIIGKLEITLLFLFVWRAWELGEFI